MTLTTLAAVVALTATGITVLAVNPAAADGEPKPRGPSTQILRSQTQTLGRAVQQNTRTTVRDRIQASTPAETSAHVARFPVVLRTDPTSLALPVAELEAGTALDVVEVVDGWAKVRYQDATAFVRSESLAVR